MRREETVIATIVLHGHDMAGTTLARPSSNVEPGQPYYDTTVGQWLVWNGTAWQGMTIVPTEAAQFITSPILNCALNSGDITGADQCYLQLTANGKNNVVTTRTATQMFADITNCAVGFGWNFSIIAAGTAVVTLIPGSGITFAPTGAGNFVIQPGTVRNFICQFTSATAATLQSVGTGIWN